MESYSRYLIPEVLSKLKGMELKARLVVEGFLIGLHKSPYKGFSVEFAEHRPYMPGDEIRKIDWKIYAKTDRFYVKEYEEETNLKAYLILDASASMAYRSDRMDKLEYGRYLAASLAYLLLKQKDSVGLCVFDTKVRRYIPPRSAAHHIHNLLKELDDVNPGGETDLSSTFHELAEKMRRRGLIIIISDLLDDPEKVVRGLKHFRHKKHEVLVFHILDPWEVDFPYEEPAMFRDMESNEKLVVDPESLRSKYKRRIESFLDYYKSQCRDSLIDYVNLNTSTTFDRALFSYLMKRKKLG
ncbi:hypothetical protein AMJ40_03555 [candidate division TA06 bacterium DG_26]|uniref:VWFA domain-containing protein n=1 Tax=candidate division TA06 bacterium DG_26 TaxID=1703771 RepID=A0A0S7WJH0_UNCT6|nr:MAG: hypothetical protein AMJ40_03555 [candidate division TA06 bacterium DG_26]